MKLGMYLGFFLRASDEIQAFAGSDILQYLRAIPTGEKIYIFKNKTMYDFQGIAGNLMMIDSSWRNESTELQDSLILDGINELCHCYGYVKFSHGLITY